MSQLIGLAGMSNCGKSTSLKYLNPAETFIISCTNKQLQIPGFRNKYKKITIEDGTIKGNWFVSGVYSQIQKVLNHVNTKRPEVKVVVIDDANYLLSKETFDGALDKGYEKFTIQAKNYVDLIDVLQNLRDDITVVIISHLENCGTEMDPEYRLWTTGKMLTSKINLDGLFSYLIYAEKYEEDDEVKYHFRTKGKINDTCRSVAGCFDSIYIEPNMKEVIDTISNFENATN